MNISPKATAIAVLVAFLAGTALGSLAFGGFGRDGQQAFDPEAVVSPAERGEPRRFEVFAEGNRTSAGDPPREARDQASPGDEVRVLRGEMEELRERIYALELRLSDLNHGGGGSQQGPEESGTVRERSTQDDALTLASLVDVGVSPENAEEIVRRQSEQEMRRLELRDRAAREGYLGTEQFFDELRELNEATPDLRDEIGEAQYDRLLFASGEDNRVSIRSVIDGSPAEQAGLRDGDIILSYDGGRIFDFSGLQGATRSGERDAPVSVEVRRGEERISLSIPRGPMGVRLAPVREDPGIE